MTKEQLKQITDALTFDPKDTSITAGDLSGELERHGLLSAQYNDWYARLGKAKLQTELNIKRLKAETELAYRSGVRVPSVEGKLTEATIKALVDADKVIIEQEDLLVEIIYWYNKAANYSVAMTQRLDIIRMLQKERER